jgi:hypothetical protein
VGVPTPLKGEPSWELSSFPTNRTFNKKLHGGPASSYEQHRLLVGSTPTAEYAYRPALRWIRWNLMQSLIHLPRMIMDANLCITTGSKCSDRVDVL